MRVSTGRSFLNLYHSKDFLDITSLDISSRGPMNLQWCLYDFSNDRRVINCCRLRPSPSASTLNVSRYIFINYSVLTPHTFHNNLILEKVSDNYKLTSHDFAAFWSNRTSSYTTCTQVTIGGVSLEFQNLDMYL